MRGHTCDVTPFLRVADAGEQWRVVCGLCSASRHERHTSASGSNSAPSIIRTNMVPKTASQQRSAVQHDPGGPSEGGRL
eukprot:4403308-Prymnesium_polylepis.1